jgi:hypothetical protein
MNMILLRNARVPALALQVSALADGTTLHLCLPQRYCDRLALEKLGEREVVFADGTAKAVPYVGPLEVRFRNRAGFVGALAMGDVVVLGAIAMEDMDLVLLPRTRELDVNPASPALARTIVARGPGASEPPGRYDLPAAPRGRRCDSSAGWRAARWRARSRASQLP